MAWGLFPKEADTPESDEGDEGKNSDDEEEKNDDGAPSLFFCFFTGGFVEVSLEEGVVALIRFIPE